MQSDHELVKAITNDDKWLFDNFFVDKTDVNISNRSLVLAITKENYELAVYFVRMILKHKVDINFQDDHGKTPLMHAVETGRIEILRCVAKYDDCNPNLEDKKGDRALHLAVKNDDEKVLSLLINANFYPYLLEINCRDKYGRTPLNLATRGDQSKCAAILWNEGLADTSVICNEFSRKVSVQSVSLEGLDDLISESRKNSIDKLLMSPIGVDTDKETQKRLCRSKTEDHAVYLSKKIANRIKSLTPKTTKRQNCYNHKSSEN